METANYLQLNYWQKAAVRHAHPVTFIFNILALLWGGYFLWIHRWVLGLICFVGISLVGLALGSLDRSYLLQAKSQLNAFQKLLVYHSNPANLILHLMGLILYVLGTWRHSVILLLGAISFALLGHIFPWLLNKKRERLYTLSVDENVSAKGMD